MDHGDKKHHKESDLLKNYEQLKSAISDFNHDSLTNLLNSGFDPNFFPKRFSLLMHAVQKENIFAVKILLKYKADINYQEIRENFTAIMISCVFGNTEIAQTLLDNNANLTSLSVDGDTVLHIASEFNQFKIVNMLLALDSELVKRLIHAKNKKGMTPLMIASQYGYTEIVKILLDKEASGIEMNTDGSTALLLSCQFKHIAVSKLLLKQPTVKAVINTLNHQQQSALYWSLFHDTIEICILLIECGADLRNADELGNNILHIACTYGLEEFIRYFCGLKNGKDIINQPNQSEYSPLMCLMKNVRVKDKQKKELAAFMIKSGARVETSEDLKSNQESAFLFACENGDMETSELLYKNKINTKQTMKDGSTALHLASEHGHHELLKKLLEKKEFLEQINLGNHSGRTPLMLSVENNDMIAVNILISHKAIIDIQDKQGKTAYMLASEFDFSKIATLLFTNGADPFMQGLKAETAASLAARNGANKAVKFLLKPSTLQTFRIPEIVEGKKTTALSLSRQSKHDEVSDMIIEALKKENDKINELFNNLESSMVKLRIMESDYYDIHHETSCDEGRTPAKEKKEKKEKREALLTLHYTTSIDASFKTEKNKNLAMVVTNKGNNEPGTMRVGMRLPNDEILTLAKFYKTENHDFTISDPSESKQSRDKSSLTHGGKLHTLVQYQVFRTDKKYKCTTKKAQAQFIGCKIDEIWIERRDRMFIRRHSLK